MKGPLFPASPWRTCQPAQANALQKTAVLLRSPMCDEACSAFLRRYQKLYEDCTLATIRQIVVSRDPNVSTVSVNILEGAQLVHPPAKCLLNSDNARRCQPRREKQRPRALGCYRGPPAEWERPGVLVQAPGKRHARGAQNCGEGKNFINALRGNLSLGVGTG